MVFGLASFGVGASWAGLWWWDTAVFVDGIFRSLGGVGGVGTWGLDMSCNAPTP